MKLFSINERGASHIILPLIVVVAVSIIGVKVLAGSHADTTTSDAAGSTGLTRVAQSTIYSTACYNGTNTVQIKAPVVPAADVQASFFNQVSDLSSGTTAANTNTLGSTQLIYANPNDVISDSIYHATAGEAATQMVDPSNVLSGESFNTASLKQCANKTIVPAYVGNGYTVSPIVVSATISRATAVNCGEGDLCNKTSGVTIADTTSTVGGFSFSVPSQQQGFLQITSGGIQPNGSLFSPLTIAPSLPNGTYTGSSTLTLSAIEGKASGNITGPTINYTIILKN